MPLISSGPKIAIRSPGIQYESGPLGRNVTERALQWRSPMTLGEELKGRAFLSSSVIFIAAGYEERGGSKRGRQRKHAGGSKKGSVEKRHVSSRTERGKDGREERDRYRNLRGDALNSRFDHPAYLDITSPCYRGCNLVAR